MDCRQFQDDMSAYLDDELPRTRAEQIRLHVEACRGCSQELKDLEESTFFVESNTRELEPGREIWAQVRSRITTFEPSVQPSGFLQFMLGHRWLTAAAGVAIIAMLTTGIWSYTEHQRSEAELRQYMTNYIRARETRSQAPAYRQMKPESGTRYTDVYYDENPFVTIRATSYENPFRSEDR